jgi:two-component system sensor histidine kinase KdpD
VGKTFAMLNEGNRRARRGSDVVVGFVETHDRPLTADAIADLEVVPRLGLEHRGAAMTDMDVDGVLARAPEVALIDELAHTNVPGCRNEKRWQDVEELLEAGIDVITTVNIQHLESLNDVVYSITGIKQAETVPDEVVRRADQIELVDMSPQALRRRLAHGNVYKPEKVDAALTNYFRVGNLTALRELALLWTADRVDQALELYREENDIEQPWPTRERVVVALTGGHEGETLLRRGARIAQRAIGGELLALHVTSTDGLSGGSPEALARQRRLVDELGGSFHMVTGSDIPDSILEFARGVNASQIVLGAPRRNRLASLFSPGVGPVVVRDSGDIDVHIVTHERTGSWRRLEVAELIPRYRKVLGWVIALLGVPLLSVLLLQWGRSETLPVALMLFLCGGHRRSAGRRTEAGPCRLRGFGGHRGLRVHPTVRNVEGEQPAQCPGTAGPGRGGRGGGPCRGCLRAQDPRGGAGAGGGRHSQHVVRVRPARRACDPGAAGAALGVVLIAVRRPAGAPGARPALARAGVHGDGPG